MRNQFLVLLAGPFLAFLCLVTGVIPSLAQDKKEKGKEAAKIPDQWVWVINEGGSGKAPIIRMRGLTPTQVKSPKLGKKIEMTSSKTEGEETEISFPRGRKLDVSLDLVMGSKKANFFPSNFGFGVVLSVPRDTAVFTPKNPPPWFKK